jgi:ribosome biogenesis protein MAK21
MNSHFGFITAKSITDRYYRTLCALLHHSHFATSSKQAMQLDLFFKADPAVAVTTTNTQGAPGPEIDAEREERGERVKALIHWFLQVGGSGAPDFIAGGLYLFREVGVAVSFFFRTFYC